ncbi:MAG: PadR family transcriptional regulator [Candidatus Diapherotrites archaeon]|nr:PadR family transcriptional regulator [Candidatus Diapherotrites archaeon]
MPENDSKIIKMLFKGHLKYLVLKALKQKKLHGYALDNACFELTNRMWKPSFGSLYPVLAKLEKNGLIRSSAENKGRKIKQYSLTRKGRRELGKIEKSMDCLKQLVKVKERTRESIIEGLSKVACKELQKLQKSFLSLSILANEGKLSNSQIREIRAEMNEFNNRIKEIAKMS